jgi:drug/metabolite transporter (DMT)-like permease
VTQSRGKGLLLATLTAVLWGCVPVAGKVALGGMSAPLLSVLRLGAAGLVVLLVLAHHGGQRLTKPPRLVYLAALGLGGNYIAYMVGLEYAGAGTSQVLIQVAPLFLILLGVVALGERPSLRELIGGGLALLGVALVSWEEVQVGGGSWIGVVLILVAALTWAVYAIAHKRLGRDHASGGTMTWIFLLAAVVVLPTVPLAASRTPDAVQVAGIVFLVLNTMVAYWAFAEALRHIPASTAAVLAMLGPAVTFGILLITNGMPRAQSYVPYEAVTLGKIVGAVLVLAGVGLAVTRRR